MDERDHLISILKETQTALNSHDAARLRELSNQTIHSASYKQDGGSITLAVVVYTISKLIERNDNIKIKKWSIFIKKFNSWIQEAIKAVEEEDISKYEEFLHQARQSINVLSLNFKPYIQDVLRKASINKASRIYEHGISLGKTAQLLGITQWELVDYMGQKKTDEKYSAMDIRKRAQHALEFFS